MALKCRQRTTVSRLVSAAVHDETLWPSTGKTAQSRSHIKLNAEQKNQRH